MLYLISAPPRTGKTLKAIEIIFKHLNQGRVVYTNIVGINIPGVITFHSEMNEPHDWRDMPNDSVIIYDEAHEHPAFADRNLIQDKQKLNKIRDIGISLTLHGHFGFDIYMITQNPRLLCAEVLASVGTHYIMRRKFGYDMATIFEYAEAKTTFSKHTAGDALNKTFWRYPKHLYKFYISSEVHNIKKTFPKKYYAFLLLPAFLFYKGFANASDTSFFGLFGGDEKAEVQSENASTEQQQQHQKGAVPEIIPKPIDERLRVASVFQSSNDCNAYNSFGELLNITVAECDRYADHPASLQPMLDMNLRNERMQAINYTQYGQSSVGSSDYSQDNSQQNTMQETVANVNFGGSK